MNVTPAYAEDAVLGGLLLDNSKFFDVASLLAVDHFTSSSRRKMFAAIRDRITANEGADAVTIGELHPELFADAIDLTTNTAGAAMVPTYAGIVRENWRRREAVRIAGTLSAAARNAEEGAVDAAISALMALNATVTECEFSGKQMMHQAWKMVQKAYESGGELPGITTGLGALDSVLGGFHDSDLTVVGARPSVGKTAFMVSLAEAAAAAGKRPGVISAEQPAAQIGLRRLSAASGVGAAHLRAARFEDGDWPRLTLGMERTVGHDLWIYDRSAISLDELVAVARKWKHTHDIGVLYVDYAQRITVPGADRITEVSTIARGLKNLARDLQIPVVSLAQVVKGVDSRPDKRPKMGDLANSDELAREADQILMLYRDVVYNPDTEDRGLAEIWIEKNRHGPTGLARAAYLEKTMRFADLEREP